MILWGKRRCNQTLAICRVLGRGCFTACASLTIRRVMPARRHAWHEAWSPVQRPRIGRDSGRTSYRPPGRTPALRAGAARIVRHEQRLALPRIRELVAGNHIPRGRLARTDGTPETHERVPRRIQRVALRPPAKTEKETSHSLRILSNCRNLAPRLFHRPPGGSGGIDGRRKYRCGSAR
jgi:hypothetical protein